MKNERHDTNLIRIHISKTGAYVLSGAALAAVSVFGFFKSVTGKKDEPYNLPLLIGSTAGMVLGTALMLEPGRRARRGAEVLMVLETKEE